MHNHYQLDDQSFEQQFAEATLDPALFSHEAHLRLAWIHLRKYGLSNAIENVCQQILNFVEKFGSVDKYSESLTTAAVEVVYHFMQQSDADNFSDFIQQFPPLIQDFKTLLREKQDNKS